MTWGMQTSFDFNRVQKAIPMKLKFDELYVLKIRIFISQKSPLRDRRRNHKVLITGYVKIFSKFCGKYK